MKYNILLVCEHLQNPLKPPSCSHAGRSMFLKKRTKLISKNTLKIL